MKIEVRFTPAMIESSADLKGRAAVVIDTLRATSTILAALMAGARDVVPAASPADAVAASNDLGNDRTLLCGERGARRLEGFHLGNSPAEYTPEVVRGKTIVLATTNGSNALLRATPAELMVCACLNNAGVAADRLERSGIEDIVVICAGTNGRFSIEDALAAGAVVQRLQELRPEILLDDSSRVSLALLELSEHDLAGVLTRGDHGAFLSANGLGEDVRACARRDIPGALVPTMVGSSIRLEEAPKPAPAIR